MTASLPTAFYWDPRAHRNNHKYSNPAFAVPDSHPAQQIYSQLEAASASEGSDSHDKEALKSASEEALTAAANIQTLLPRCATVYAYSTPKDLINQLYALCGLLSSAATKDKASDADVAAVSPENYVGSFDRNKSHAAGVLCATPPLLVFLAHDAPAAHLPLIRYACFLASHVPSVVTVLYPEAPAVSSSPSSSPAALDICLLPGDDRRNPNAVRGAVPNAVLHALRSCGVAAVGGPELGDACLEDVLVKAAGIQDTAVRVLDKLKRAAEAKVAKEQTPGYKNIYFNKLTSRPVSISKDEIEEEQINRAALVCPVPLFENAYDYYVLNFLFDLELFHSRNFLETDSPYAAKALFESDEEPPAENADEPFEFAEADHPAIFHLSPDRVAYIKSMVGNWNFEAHSLTYNDLLFAAFLMFKHVFAMKKGENDTGANGSARRHSPTCSPVNSLIISDTRLFKFLLVVRDSYYPTNPYHNFRHAIDVLQASFYFMLKLNSIPQYNTADGEELAATPILDPLEALTLLIIAIGHDVGHPGMTNAFLTSAKSPIATAFGYKSVLESYHSAAFSRILQLYWPATQEQPVCRLIMQSVHATDMGLHFDYMSKAEETREIVEKYGEVENYIEEMDDAIREQQKQEAARDEAATASNGSRNVHTDARLKKLRFQTLVCCLLIKCADISNVTRSLSISSRWGVVLSKEFGQVEALEVMLGLKPAPKPAVASSAEAPAKAPDLRVQPVESDGEGFHIPVLALAKGQLFFINTFARPLFEMVAHLFPHLDYTMEILQSNAEYWKDRVSSLS